MGKHPDAPCTGVQRGFFAVTAAGVLSAGLYVAGSGTVQAQIQCTQTITANVAVLDSPTVFNRLGAQNPNWITYALLRDVVNAQTLIPCTQTQCAARRQASCRFCNRGSH